MCIEMCGKSTEAIAEEMRLAEGAEVFAGSRVFVDALGQDRCGLTGARTSSCECRYWLPTDFSAIAGYRGQPTWDWDDDEAELYIPSGQAPLAITA